MPAVSDGAVRLALQVKCPYCGAEPGKKCRTKFGKGPEAEYVHVSRADKSWKEKRS